MTWSDTSIRTGRKAGVLSISPFCEEQINPASYDLTLHPVLRVNDHDYPEALDLASLKHDGMTEYVIEEGQSYQINPGEFLLASTYEYISLNDQLCARVEGKSSLARLGLAVHVTGGFIDPGFKGQITLEIKNLSGRPLIVYPGIRIAQIAFQDVFGRVNVPYAQTGRYQNQIGPTASRYTCVPERVPIYSCDCWTGTSVDWEHSSGEVRWCEPCAKNRMTCPNDHCLECGANT